MGYGIVRLRGCTQKRDMKTPLTCNQQKHEREMGEAHGVGPHNEINYILSLLSAVHVWSSPEHPCCVQEQPDPDHQLHPGLGAVAREGLPGERTRREQLHHQGRRVIQFLHRCTMIEDMIFREGA